MRTGLLWSLVLLAGCAPVIGGGAAGPGALRCAESLVGSLGYQRVAGPGEGVLGAFTARKPLPSQGMYPVVGEIGVLVRGENGGERLRVTAARYELRGAGPAVNIPTAIPGGPAGVPGRAAPRPRASRRGERRLPPGPVASDAELVRQQCGRREAGGADEVAASAARRP
jgi:hypothetical protein